MKKCGDWMLVATECLSLKCTDLWVISCLCVKLLASLCEESTDEKSEVSDIETAHDGRTVLLVSQESTVMCWGVTKEAMV